MQALENTKIAIVGLGYVGLPLAVEFARAGFHVTRNRCNGRICLKR